MDQLPRRTGASGMAEDDLLILDSLALLGKAPVKALYRDDYATGMNVRYTHSVPDRLMEGKMAELVGCGHVIAEPDELWGTAFALSRSGGVAWELERSPIWQRFCTAVFGSPGGGHEQMVLHCLDCAIGTQFAQALRSSCQYVFPPEGVRFARAPSDSVLQWRTFDAVWVCQIEVRHLHRPPEPAGSAQREWWTTLEELQKFLL